MESRKGRSSLTIEINLRFGIAASGSILPNSRAPPNAPPCRLTRYIGEGPRLRQWARP